MLIRLRVFVSLTSAALCSCCFVACAGSGNTPNALPQPNILARTLVAPAVLNETPLPADAFPASVGLNENVANTANPTTAADWPKLISLLRGLGVRHVRDGILDADPPYDLAITQLLAASNAKLDGITDCAGIALYPGSPTSPAQIQAFDTAIGNGLESVEGPNEVDLRADPNWAADTIACLPSLRSAEPTLPFLAPSISNQLNDAPTLGNISADVDEGNLHRYYSGRNPGTAGWGGRTPCGIYGALSWALCEAQINSGSSKPVVVTETGYNSKTEVDEVTQAKYLSRALLVDLQAGVPISYVYDFRDYTGGDAFGNDGLIRTNDSTKPAYTALYYEMAWLNDPGTPVTPIAFPYSITGGNTIDHLLFQKRNGQYILALWNETASWNPATSQEIPVAPQPVTVTLDVPALAVTAVAFNDAGHLANQPVTTKLNTMTVSVNDYVTFLNFNRASPSPSPSPSSTPTPTLSPSPTPTLSPTPVPTFLAPLPPHVDGPHRVHV